ncbi:MAG: DUF3703 domain-containing protein [Ilumatobacteraceae bacterium]|nr:DUF3703 domain-containing protein [Ilumatobacteraceae bacterium]
MPSVPKQPKLRNQCTLTQHWKAERDAARQARSIGNHAVEWVHLERAHILSQPMAVAHVRTHLVMLAFAIRRHDRREITGQLIRTIVAGPGSAMRRYPLGNTGGANVSAVAPMPIPDDLRGVVGAA